MPSSYDPTLFNVSPYYDDFDEDKKFHRLLFKPGYAVQARELTQAQTILQNQIERFGNHIFKEGSRVLGSEIVANSTSYVRMLPFHSVVSGITQFLDFTQFQDKIIQSGEGLSATKAKVVHIQGPSNADYDNYTVFFLDYLQGSGFTAGEELMVKNAGATAVVAPSGYGTTASNGQYAGGINPADYTTVVDAQNAYANDAVAVDGIDGKAKVVSVTPGIYFINGSFVKNTSSKVAPYGLTGASYVTGKVRYFKNPTSRIGFDVSQEIVSSADDFSLRDPSAGSYNYNAPGADRYKIDLKLSHTQYALGLNIFKSDPAESIPVDYINFIELMRYKEGKITYKNLYTQYNELEKTLARRTYDESGNYTVKPFNINMQEHLDDGTNNGIWQSGRTSDGGVGASADYLACALEPGKAYIFGHEFETQATEYVDVRKARGSDHEKTLDLYKPNSSEEHGTWFYATAGRDFSALFGNEMVDAQNDTVRRSWTRFRMWGNSGDQGIYSSGDDIPVDNSEFGEQFDNYTDERERGIGDGSCYLGLGWIDGIVPAVYGNEAGASAGQQVTIRRTVGSDPEKVYKVSVLGIGRRRPLSDHDYQRPLKRIFNATAITVSRYPEATLRENFAAGMLPDYQNYTNSSVNTPGNRENVILHPIRKRRWQSGANEIYHLKDVGEAKRYNRVANYAWNNRSHVFWHDRGNVCTNVSKLQYDFNWTFTAATGDNFAVSSDDFIPAAAGNPAYVQGAVFFNVNWTESGSEFNNFFQHAHTQGNPLGLSPWSQADKQSELILTRKTFDTTAADGYVNEIVDLSDWIVNIVDGFGARRIKIEPPVGQEITIKDSFILSANVRVVDNKVNGGQTGGFQTVGGRTIVDAEQTLNPTAPDGAGGWRRAHARPFRTGVRFNFWKAWKDSTHTTKETFWDAQVANVSKVIQIHNDPTAVNILTGLPWGATSDVTSDFLLSSGAAGAKITGWSYIVALAGTYYDGMRTSSTTSDLTPYVNGVDGATFDNIEIHYTAVRSTAPSSRIPHPVVVNSYDVYDKIQLTNLYGTGRVSRPQSLTSVVDFRYNYHHRLTNSDRSNYTYKTAGGVRIIPSSLHVEHNYHLPRVDKVVLSNQLGSQNSTFKVLEGRPSDVPMPPDDRKDSLTLYTLLVPPYTHNPGDVIINQVNHQRYTMKDIGRLDKKITAVEHYTSLSLLEKDTLGKQMFRGQENLPDGSAGDYELWKAGIFIDQFSGHDKGDVSKWDYRCSIDYENNILRPPFDLEQIKFETPTTSEEGLGTGLQVSSDGLITRTVVDTSDFVYQDKASTSISVNPFNLANWLGHLEISPPASNFMDMTRRPAVKTFNGGLNDNWRSLIMGGKGLPVDNFTDQLRGFGSQWNDWESIWSGIELGDNQFYSERGRLLINRAYTKKYESSLPCVWNDANQGSPRNAETIDQTKTSAGMKARNNPEQITVEINNKIIDKSVVPYMKSETLTIKAKALKPNTTVYAFFDDKSVDTYCKLSDGQVGPFKTNSNGEIITSDGEIVSDITFTIPSKKYLTGEKLFRLTDNELNDVFQSSTSAEETYYAVGQQPLNDEIGINSTRPALVQRQTVTSNKVVRDISSRTQTIDTRVNTQWVDPLAQTFTVDVNEYKSGMFADSICLYFASKDEFDPVTIELRPLLNGRPHGSHVIPFSRVTKNPSDIDVNVSSPASETEFKFSSPVYLAPGDYAVVIKSNSVETQLWAAEMGQVDITTNHMIDSQPYSGVLYHPQNSSIAEVNQSMDLKFKLRKCVFDTGTSSSVCEAKVNYTNELPAETHLLRINSNDLTPPNTKLNWTMAWDGDSDISAGMTTRVYPNENIDTKATNPGHSPVYKKISDTSKLRVSFTGNSDVSPVLDMKNLDMFVVRNVVNNVARTEAARWAWGLVDDRADARYISRRVTLSEDVQANHLRVFLDISQEEDRRGFDDNAPSGTYPIESVHGVQVWVKKMESDSTGETEGSSYTDTNEETSHLDQTDEQQDSFDNKRYYQLIPVNNPWGRGPTETDFDFREVEYRLPDYLSDEDGDELIGTFSVKVVMFAHDRSRPPKVKNLRAVACVG
jgi:hypothetical protein